MNFPSLVRSCAARFALLACAFPGSLALAQVPIITAVSAPRQVVNLGQNLTLGASASGATSFQWKRSGRPVPGATAANYAIAEALPWRDAGWYQLVAVNAAGSTTSAVIFVQVAVPGPQIVVLGGNAAGIQTPPAGLGPLVSVAANGGAEHGLALKIDGTVVGWGYNAYGQASPPAGLNNVVALSSNFGTSLALKADGSTAAWGVSGSGFLPVPVGLPNFVDVAIGNNHAIGLLADGTVRVWGNGPTSVFAIPANLSNVVAISAGGTDCLALKADGTVIAWGNNYSGETSVPAGLSNVVALRGGLQHSVALQATGTVVGWGLGGAAVPPAPSAVKNGVALAAGTGHTLALEADGTVLAWGDGSSGQTAIPSGLDRVVTLAGGASFSVVLRDASPAAVPVITLQPVSGTTSGTGVAAFRIAATGFPWTTFQWQRQPAGTVGYFDLAAGSIYSGTNTPTLLVSLPTLAMSGDMFRCLVAHGLGLATSQSAALVVTNAPIITTQPTDQTVTAGQTATFTVGATGPGTLNYLWRRHGSMIPGVAGPTLTIPHASRIDADDYEVAVFPAAGGAAVNSNRVRLQVAPTSYPGVIMVDRTRALYPEINVTGAINGIRSFALLPGGGYYAAGLFTRVEGVRRPCLIRVRADHTLDATFPAVEFDGAIRTVALQPDGRLLVGGDFLRVKDVRCNRLVRLMPDGLLDESFDPRGGADGEVATIVPQAGGRILVGGSFSKFGGRDTSPLVRLLPDGTLDDSFLAPAAAAIFVVRELPNGQIMAGGSTINAPGLFAGSLVRLNGDGFPDSAFPAHAVSGGAVYALQQQADGKLVLGGAFSSVWDVPRGGIARLNADGTLDSTFDPGTGAGGGSVNALALTATGRIVIGGSFTNYNGVPVNRVTRLTSSGVLDAGFAVGTGAGSTVNALASLSGDELLVGGAFSTLAAGTKWYLGRFVGDTFNFLPNFTFRGSGEITTSLPLPDGRTIVAGLFNYLRGATVPGGITRVQADGSVDPTFNSSITGGPAGTGASGGRVAALRRLADGRLAIGGQFTSYAGVARGRIALLNADGTLATSFDPGEGLSRPSTSTTVSTIAERNGGSLVVGGNFTTASGSSRNGIAAYELDGTLSGDFQPGSGFDLPVNTIAALPDGRLLVGGSFRAYNGVTVSSLVRLSISGVLDTTFNAGGSGPDAVVQAIAPLADGRIMISGAFTTYNGVARPGIAWVLASGALDESFGPAGGGEIPAVLVQEDGRVIIRGHFTIPGATPPREFLARLNVDGSLDNSFLAGGLNASTAVPSTIAMRDDGQLLLHEAGLSGHGTWGFAAMRAAAPPVIATLSGAQSVFAGGAVTIAVTAESLLPAAYQWHRNGLPIPGANGLQLVLPAASAAEAGLYTVVVSSELGSVTSAGVMVTVNGAPTFLREPTARYVGVGGLTSFQVVADGVGPFSYQWRRDGAAVPGATTSTLVVPAVVSTDAGDYTVAVTNGAGTTVSTPALLTVRPNPIAYSARQYVGPAGAWGHFSIVGPQPKKILLRALGPALASLGLEGGLADPALTLCNAVGQPLAGNDNWGDAAPPNLAAVFAQVGAMALPAGSRDAVIFTTLAPGSYTARVTGVGGAAGIAWLELYDADVDPASRLAYVGLRGRVEAATGALAGGVTMTNSAAKRLLIRAVGPTLGTAAAHPDPLLRILDGATLVTENDNWGGGTALVAATAAAGAFPLPAGSADAAVLLDQRVGSGAYTVQLPPGSAAGEVLLEFHDLPLVGESMLAPLVVGSPANQTAAAGGSTVLRALVDGRGPLTYQWRRDGIAVPGATGATLTLDAVTPAHAGLYDVLVASALGSAASSPALFTVGNTASHRLAGVGYFAGGTVTLANVLSYTGAAGSLGWSVTLPAGWSFASDSGAAGDPRPKAGDTGTIAWAWTNVPPSPVEFSYTVNIPVGESGARTLSATALVRPPGGELIALPVTPEPLAVPQNFAHSGDTDRNFRLSLLELTRMIELYNVRYGTTRTGAYAVAAGATEDDFAPEPTRALATAVTLTRYHSADSNRDGKIGLVELTRVIELYNTRSGTTRTGAYHVLTGTEDGFAAGP